MSEDNTGGAVSSQDNSILTGNTDAEPALNDSSTDGGNDDSSEVTYKLDEDGNQILDDDGNPIPEDTSSPDDYEPFEVPEGMEIDEELLGVATGTLKELGLNQEQAQKVVNLYSNKIQQDMKLSAERIDSWANDARTDSEYGGKDFDASVLLANRALKEFGNEEIIDVLKQTGLSQHPEMIRLMVNVGKTLQEDSPSSTKRGQQKLSRTEILYPDS